MRCGARGCVIVAALWALVGCGVDEPKVDDEPQGAQDMRADLEVEMGGADAAPDLSGPRDMEAPDLVVADMTPDMDEPADMTAPEDMEPDLAQPEDMAPPDMEEPGGSGELCEAPVALTAPVTVTGQTTVGAGDDMEVGASQAGCPQGRASGPERFYEVRATAAGRLKIRVEPQGSFDPLLYVLASCEAQTCLAGTALNGSGVAEEVTLDVSAGQVFIVVVDGELGSAGGYSLEVSTL